MVATPYSYRQYAGNASNRDFAVPFPFLVRANVGVYFGLNVTTGAYTTKLVDGTDYTWTNDTSIRTTTAPAVGVTLSVMRATPSSDLAVQWQDGSTLIAEDLLTSDRQNLYVVQENTDLTALNSALSQASSTTANTALTNSTAAQAAAAAATTTANTASSNASAAVSTANTASTNATAAVTTANTAGTNASAAVTTANTASTNASAAVSTANTASSTAATALSTANSATTAAAAATSTANTASGNASAAVSTANTASANASTAVSTANTANTNASAAVSTANTASTNASTAVSTANSTTTTANNALTFATAANTKSDTAIAAVAASVAYTPVANVAAIPGSPANDTYISVTDSTGLQSFTPLSGIPAGFAGDAGLTARLVYKTATTSWVWIDYYANNADARYLKTSGGTMTGALVLSGAPTSGLHPATKTYVDSADTTLTAAAAAAQATANTGVTNAAAAQATANTGVTNAAAAQATANAALPKAGGTMTGAIAFDLATQQKATTSTYGITQLTNSTTSTDTGTAATAASVKSAADLASAAGTTANAALPKAGGTMTGALVATAGTVTANGIQVGTGTTYKPGIYSPGTDQLAISTNGTSRLLIDASGNVNIDSNTFYVDAVNNRVGLGTSSPSYLLDAYGSAAIGIRYKGSYSYGAVVVDNSNTTGGGYFAANQNGTQKALFGVAGAIQGNTNSDAALFAETGQGIQFFTNGAAATPKAVITSAGLVGIGSTSPNRTLHVFGDTALSNSANTGTFLFAPSASANFLYSRAADSVTTALPFALAVGSTEALRVDTSGRLLVGTSTLLSGVASSLIQASQSASDYVIACKSTHSTPYGYYIGYSTSPNNTGSEFLVCTDATTTRASIRSNGGLANFSANNANLSDRNAKKDISPAADTWNCLKKWEIVNYRYKDQPADADLNLGVIAQQVAESCPEVITVFEEAKDDQPEKLGVKEQQMYWMAIKALQEAQVRIETLEAEVAALKGA